MYISPQSEFRVLKNVPFNSDFKHTILFNSISEQISFFTGCTKKSYSEFSYVRKDRVVRVPVITDEIYDCNYCMFKNNGFGQKWFYAFITNIEYINNGLAALTIAIDPIQTWMFEFNIEKSYVVREHVADDSIGKHTLDENLPFGDVVQTDDTNHIEGWNIIAAYNDGGASSLINNVYSPVSTVSVSDAASADALLSQFADQPEKVAFVTMGCSGMEGEDYINFSRTIGAFSFAGESYTPKNKKLYCYPYDSFSVDDYGQNVANFKWEDFENNTSVVFNETGSISPTPVLSLVPLNYKGAGTAYQYELVKTDFPQCPYTIDNYRAWQSSVGLKQQINMDYQIQQNTLMDAADLITAIMSVASIASDDSGSGDMSNLSSIGHGILNHQSRQNALNNQAKLNAVDKSYAQTHGISTGGTIGSCTAAWARGNIGWRFIRNQIKPEYARMIDDFFTRFGYKVNVMKVPELKSRSTFNYVKTIDCNITGDIPNYANQLISQIFDNGITLWHTTNVGNYSLANEVVNYE